MTERRIVIVGAGPAGMAAAVAAAHAGLKVTLVDDNPDVGGQIYRQPPAAFASRISNEETPESIRGAQLRSRFEAVAESVEHLKETAAWGFFKPMRLAVSCRDDWQMIDAESLILAAGAYEYVPPFPGWTTVGVMTPGGAQVMVKSMRVRPGRRVLLAGTGPFLLVVAQALAKAGMDVVGVVEAASRFDVLRQLPGLMTDFGQLKRGRQYLRFLKRAGIPLYAGHVILEARGGEELEQAVFAPCDRNWRPDRSRAQVVDVDTLCVGYGFVPRTQLAQLAGCRMQFSELTGGWIPIRDENFETDVRGLWVAGDGGGVAGALVAELEGTLAGLAVAHRHGALDDATYKSKREPITRQLRKLSRFRNALDRISKIRPGLSELADEETVVCRCEELTRSEIDTGIEAGGTNLRTLKVMTRLGMGPCQGRMCWPAMARYIALRTNQSIEQAGPLNIRPPIRPVAVSALCEQTAQLDDSLASSSTEVP